MKRHEVAGWVRGAKVPPITKLVLLLVFDRAGEKEDGRWSAWPKQAELADEAGVGVETIRKHLVALEEAGIIEREARFDARGRQTSSRIVLLVGAPSGQRGLPLEGADEVGGPPPTDGGGQSLQAQHEAQDRSVVAPANTRSPEIEATAREVHAVLLRTVAARPQRRAVELEDVLHALDTYPDRQHRQIALDLERWLTRGKGLRRSSSDVIGRYRNWLKDAEPSVALPEGVTPIRPTSRLAEQQARWAADAGLS